jgi:hypothetical protein
MKLLDRFRSPSPGIEHDALEAMIHRAFSFLEEGGFERTGSERFSEGVEVRYRNRSTAVGLRFLASSRDAAWGWIGRLDSAGRLRPLDRDTVDDGTWSDLSPVVGFETGGGPGPLALLADAVRANTQNLVPPEARRG